MKDPVGEIRVRLLVFALTDLIVPDRRTACSGVDNGSWKSLPRPPPGPTVGLCLGFPLCRIFPVGLNYHVLIVYPYGNECQTLPVLR